MTATRLSHETVVWIRNGWPVFRCVHAHCDGGVNGVAKKTWKDFQLHYDPLRLFFDWDEWMDDCLLRRGLMPVGGAR